MGVLYRPRAHCCMLRLEWFEWMCLSACVFVSVCVQSVSICANQAKTNVLLHSSFAFKILHLVPLVWLLEHISPKTTTKLSLSLKWTVCGCRGDLGVGFTVAFLFKFVGFTLQRLYELRVCHLDDEEHITRSLLPWGEAEGFIPSLPPSPHVLAPSKKVLDLAIEISCN